MKVHTRSTLCEEFVNIHIPYCFSFGFPYIPLVFCSKTALQHETTVNTFRR